MSARHWTLLRLGIGLAAAWLVFIVSYIPWQGGAVSPCQSPDFLGSFEERTYETTKDDRLFPPGSVCRAYTADGRFIRKEVYPKPAAWLGVAAAFAAPFAFVGLYRRAPIFQRAGGWLNRL